MPVWLTRSMWVTTVFLVCLGVAAAAWRAAFIADAAARLEFVRPPILAAFGVTDRLEAERPQHIRVFDERFAHNPLPTLAHVVFGALFLVLAPLQFVAAVRNRHRALHRWSGRVLVGALGVAAASGLYFGVLIPFSGTAERVVTVLVGATVLTALARAVTAIRRGQVARHREWMIRAFAMAIAISVVRVVAAPIDLTMTSFGFQPQPMLALSLWLGWFLSMAAGEVWIRYSRSGAAAVLFPAPVRTDRSG